jgi:alkylation response protein AidB-like acyl-CoA dehydrogenase
MAETSLADQQTPEAPGVYATDLAGYRRALREWLTTPTVDEWREAEHQSDVAEQMAFTARLVRTLYDEGFGRYGSTVSGGGLGGDVRHWAVLFDELARADLPIPGQYDLLTTLGPPVMAFSPELAAQYLPGFLRGDEWWAQGFSEPEAGSDLAALRCRATPVDDGYLVSGQKLWTSHAATASRLVCLVRTGTPESRHRGLTMLMIDVESPGVTVRPLRLANGRAELAECFFDDVHVPVERRIGEEGSGWSVAMYLLQFERAAYAWMRAAHLFSRLRALTRQVPASETAQRVIGSAYLDLTALRARSVTTVRRLAAGETVGPESSVDKILLGNAEHSVLDAARQLLGARLILGSDPGMHRWREEWWYSRTATIYGGSAEVQRSIVADRVLKLPKE